MLLYLIRGKPIIFQFSLLYHTIMNMYVRLVALLACLPFATMANDDAVMADIHLHFNWNQEEVISAEEVLQRLREQNVTLALVTSVPSDNAVKLRDAGGDWIFPFYSPYINAGKRGMIDRSDVLFNV